MNITTNVIHDLLPVYLSGEASPDTVALVDDFLRRDPVLAGAVDTMRTGALPNLSAALPPTREKETLDRTRRLLRWRGILLALATFLTLLPLSFRFDDNRITWTFLGDAPPSAAAFVAVAALASWVAFLSVRRRLHSTGL